MKYIEMKQKDIKILKEKLWLKNYKKCPVLNKKIELNKMVLDHAHKTKSADYSETEGVIREALEFRTNAVLGKLENALKRTGLSKDEDFNISTFLRNAADYFEAGAYTEDDIYFIHPNEVHKDPEVSKKNYNKLKKIYNGKAKFPDYPKSKKLTVPLKKLFDIYEIPYFN